MNILKRLSIRSKFIILMLIVSITSIVAIGIIGNHSGGKILKKSVSQELRAVENIKSKEIESYFNDTENSLKMLVSNKMIVNSIRDFITSYNLTEYNALNNKQKQELYKYYQTTIISKIEKQVNSEVSIENILPKTVAANYLQYNYIVKNPKKNKSDLVEANDHSSYSKTHAKYHNSIKNIIKKLDFEDLFFIDSDSGNIVYSVKKNIDFATNLSYGVYSRSNLAKLVDRLRHSVKKDKVLMVDYDRYLPEMNRPAAFMGIVIYDSGEKIGQLIVELSPTKIDKILSSNYSWKDIGLGKTGDIYLVGSDYKMRSNNRYMIQQPNKFKKILKKINIQQSTIENIYEDNTTLLNLDVNTPEVNKALKGGSGTAITKNYLKQEVLASYAPLNLKFVNWAIVSQKNLSEANEDIMEFRKKFAISTIILTFLVTLFAMFSAGIFTKPINALIDGIERIYNGKIGKKIEIDTSDEFSNLADSFNKMIQKQSVLEKDIKSKNIELDELLLNMMPEPIAKRYKSGEKAIVEQHDNITVVFTALTGFSEIYQKYSSAEAFSLLNNLIEAFDEAAMEFGVEKVAIVGDDYLAACGLNTPRFDHSQKAVSFALEIISIVDNFNRENITNVSIQIGLDSGKVTEGLIGTSKFEYSIWGDAVDIASNLRYEADVNSIRITKHVYDSLDKKDYFIACPSVYSKEYGEIINYQYLGDSKEEKDV